MCVLGLSKQPTNEYYVGEANFVLGGTFPNEKNNGFIIIHSQLWEK